MWVSLNGEVATPRRRVIEKTIRECFRVARSKTFPLKILFARR
jgi:hypothetical protein